MNAVILKGVTIGENSVVPQGSGYKSVEPNQSLRETSRFGEAVSSVKPFNAQRSTLNAKRSIRKLDVGCSTLSVRRFSLE